MISSAIVDIRIVHSDPPFFPFWAWSVLLHIGVVTLFSILHFSNNIELPQAVVKVTLVETTSPSMAEPMAETQHQVLPPAEPVQTKKQTPAPPTPQEAPALMITPRQILPIPQSTISIPTPLAIPKPAHTLTQVLAPQIPVKPVPTIDRGVLQDSHATNNLNLKNLLKVTQRTPTSRTTSQMIKPQVKNLLSSATLSPNFPTQRSTAAQSRSRPIKTRTLIPNVLKAMVPGSGNISKSKVGLGRTLPPIYPRIARESGWEGTVLVRVTVQPDGSPESIKIRKSSGHVALDRAALEAVKKWRFLPAKDGNIPIRSVVEIPINFDLKKQG